MPDDDTVTYKEHLAWCKQRALEYVDRNDTTQAWMSFMSDMNKHDGTRGHQFLTVGSAMFATGHLREPADLRRFIEDFN